jgi:hypothetical protein
MSCNAIKEDRTEGKKCPTCFEIVMRIEVSDFRAEDEQHKRPLKNEEKTMLWCACNHPGDCIIGGFF